MKKKRIRIKRLGIVISLMIFSSLSTIAQVLIKPSLSKNKIDFEWEEKIKHREGFESYQIIDLDLNALNQNKNIEAYCFDSKIIVHEKNKIVRSINNYSWFGSNDDNTSFINICVTGKDVQGFLTQKDKLYKIETVNGTYILLKLNQSQLNKKDCGVVNTVTDESNIKTKGSVKNNFLQKTGNNFSCKIRVLVLYTPAAFFQISNIQGHAQISVDQMNQTFVNSGISAEAELVHVQLTNYTETNISPTSSATHDNDLTRFTTDGDGYMDEVHDLRREYSADVCVLMSDIPNSLSFAGIARTIKSSTENSFCIVDYWYSYLNITFAHEMGHLIGCRHNESSDSSTQPYPYGHGYTVDDPSNGSWRTIMGTTSSCNGCPRNPYWSNPNVSIPFGVTGTVTTNDNARVIDENFENFKSHRPTNGTLFANQSKVTAAIGNSLYNSNNITTDGNVTINSSETFSLYAGHQIILEPGFSAKAGSEFTAEIVPPCGTADGLQNDYGLQPDSISLGLKNSIATNVKNYLIDNGKIKVSSLNVFPNPTTSELNLLIELPEDNNQLKISIVNFNGQLLQTIFTGQKKKGVHKLNTSISSLNTGVYFVLITIDNTDIISHKIIKQ